MAAMSKGTERVIEVTGILQKQAWADREMPPVEQVAPLVWSIPVPTDGLSIRYTLCYLLASKTGEFVIVDPGMDSEVGWQDLLDGISQAGYRLEKTAGVVTTHLHVDHIGMVARLVEATGAWFAMSEDEANTMDRTRNAREVAEIERSWLQQCSVPGAVMESMIAGSGRMFHAVVAWERPNLILRDGDELPLAGRHIRVLLTPGHTPGHVCLADLDEELILTGDHVLPRISPNIGSDWTNAGRDALKEYLDSLDILKVWDSFEVCPAHEYRFRGLAGRIDELEAVHSERSAEVVRVLAESGELSLWQVAERLTWSRGWDKLDGDNLRGALSETSAHVAYLNEKQIVRRSDVVVDGVHHWAVSLR